LSKDFEEKSGKTKQTTNTKTTATTTHQDTTKTKGNVIVYSKYRQCLVATRYPIQWHIFINININIIILFIFVVVSVYIFIFIVSVIDSK